MSRWITYLLRSTAAALVGLAVLSGMGDAARADLISFDPDGAGGVAGPSTISGFDWFVGNALAKGAIPVTPGQEFDLLYQASLTGLIDPAGKTFTPTGLNTSYEITVVASIRQVITGVVGNSITFAVAANQSNSFFRMYQGAVDSDSLAGTGFDNGTLILSATPDPTIPGSDAGSFALTGEPNQAFDRFDTNNYPGITSVVGNGSSQTNFTVNSTNAQYFLTAPLQPIFNSSNSTPFRNTNPSRAFLGYNPLIGPINGTSGPDFQFQADGNTAVVIPEPASLSLLGLGLLGLAGAMRRSRKPSA